MSPDGRLAHADGFGDAAVAPARPQVEQLVDALPALSVRQWQPVGAVGLQGDFEKLGFVTVDPLHLNRGPVQCGGSGGAMVPVEDSASVTVY